MATESSVIVGSGLNPLKVAIPVDTQGQQRLKGTNVICLNPEDASVGSSGVITAVTVGTSAVALPTSPMDARRALSIRNNSTSNILYIGFDSTVTDTTGFPVRAGESIPFDFTASLIVWGIASAAGTDVRVLEVS